MNIWIFNHYALPPSIPGPSRHYNLAKELIEKGHEVTIFASSFHFTMYRETQVFEKSEKFTEKCYDGVKFVWVKTYPYKGNSWKRYVNILDYTLKVFTIAQKLAKKGKPDIVIGSSFHLFAPVVAYYIAKRLNIPFISEIRDLWPETLVQLGTSPKHPLVRLLGRIERFIYRRSMHIIVLFPKAHEYILGLNIGVQRSDITWIPNGVKVDTFDVPVDNTLLDSKFNFLDKDKFKVLNAGSLGNVYSLEHLIEAAKLVQNEDDNVHFYLVGNGPLKDVLINYAQKLDLYNISFHDAVPKVDMPQLLKNCDVLYASLMNSPLYKWGMSLNKVSEYLAAGKPIVFAVDAANNPVNDAQAGVTVKSNNPQEISAAILKLKETSLKDKEQMSIDGVRHARDNYDMSILVDRLETILLKTIKEFKNESLPKGA